MVDVHTPEQRRRNMQAVRAKDTRPEQRLRSALRATGIRGYRANYGKVLGKPDVAFTRWKVAVFVDGCFWHGCPLCYREPRSNTSFWVDKLQQNRNRDITVTEGLRADGWLVLRLWEHEVKSDADGCVPRKIGRAHV